MQSAENLSRTQGLEEGGTRLWAALLAQDEALTATSNPLREIALEACRTKDRCDQLDEICRREPPTVLNARGRRIAHPAWAEVRQQETTLRRLVAALRLPDPLTGRRPQRRGARGVYRPSGGSQ
ncbi:MAG: hypothetical protein M3Q22_14225 [Actinomycetota bacterium]|nr:hypothetical protein [Actinomycetota bacterium]